MVESSKPKNNQANSQRLIQVYINVYDLPNLKKCNSCTGMFGLGAYHTAIQVGK